MLVYCSASPLDAAFSCAPWVAWNQLQSENLRCGYQLQIKVFFPKSQLLNISPLITGWGPTIFIWPNLLRDSDAAHVWAALAEKAFPAHLPSPGPSLYHYPVRFALIHTHSAEVWSSPHFKSIPALHTMEVCFPRFSYFSSAGKGMTFSGTQGKSLLYLLFLSKI